MRISGSGSVTISIVKFAKVILILIPLQSSLSVLISEVRERIKDWRGNPLGLGARSPGAENGARCEISSSKNTLG